MFGSGVSKWTVHVVFLILDPLRTYEDLNRGFGERDECPATIGKVLQLKIATVSRLMDSNGSLLSFLSILHPFPIILLAGDKY